VVVALAAWAWGAGFRTFSRWRASDWRDRLLAALAMPMLIFFFLVIFTRPVRGHWPVPAYVTALILSAAVVTQGGTPGRRLHAGSLAVLAVAYFLAPLLLPVVVPSEKRSGWASLAAEVAKRKPDFVICHEYHHASQMAYLLRTLDAWEMTPVGKPSKNSPNWWTPEPYRGRNAVFVAEARKLAAALPRVEESFERVGSPEAVSVPRVAFPGKEDKKREYVILRAWGYRGPKTVDPRAPPSDD